jgi:uncharacterized protein UPF0236
MTDIIGLIAELMPVFENIITMTPNNIQELESHVREVTTQIGAKVMKLKLESMDRELSSSVKSMCKCKVVMYKRKRHRQILTTFGKIDVERTMSQCSRWRQTKFALDEALRLEPYSRVSPMLKKISVLCAASWSYELAKYVLSEILGTDVISTEEIQKLSISISEDIIEEEEKEELEQKDLRFEYDDSYPSRIYIDVDGGMVNSWDEANRMEGKAAVIWSKKIKVKGSNEIVDKFYTGTFNNYEELIERIYCDLWRRTESRTEGVEVVIRGDGANWIRQMKKDYFQGALYILDWYHLVKKIGERLEQAIEDEILREEIEEELKNLLYDGKVKEAIDKLQELGSKLCVEGQEAVERLIGYIQRNQEGMWYKEARERGIDIGVGTAEKAVDLVICRRFKQRGMIWTRRGANALIKIRLLVLNKRWNQYWESKLAA